MYGNPGNGFIIRLVSLNSGTATLTHAFEKTDLEAVANVPLAFTTAASTTTGVCTTLGSTNTYVGRIIECVSSIDANSALNVGQRRLVTGYVVASQTMTFAAFPQQHQVGDRFKILSPMPKGCSKAGFCGLSLFHATVNTTVPVSYTITDPNGKVWKSMFFTGTGTPYFGHSSLCLPVEFAPGDGSITITVANGTWAAVNEYFFNFYAT